MTSVYIAEGAQEEGTLSFFKEFTGLTTREKRILALLIENNGMIVEDLARITGFNYTAVKDVLKSLRDKGLVKSNPEKSVRAELIPTVEVA
ncbi:MAG: MarR family transcriptional regulator [Theionarchaea archaeon]|nr:MarR family transcriptional regulator [Theionarchaea archaeon]